MTTNQPGSAPEDPASAPCASSWEPMPRSEPEDPQAPPPLELLYHSAPPSSPSDAVVLVAHLLMMETGFVPDARPQTAAEMPAGWRSADGPYKLHYSHPLCGSSRMVLVAVRMSSTLVINAFLKVNEKEDTVHKLCLHPSSYVTDEWPGESAAAAFKDLDKLCHTFKDQLAYPLIAAAREASGLPVTFGLPALPPELLLRVLMLLDIRSVVRLSSVCRHFQTAIGDSWLWRHLFRRDFTDSDPIRSTDTDWKQLYKQRYKSRNETRRPRHRWLPPFPQHPRDIFIPLPMYPPLPGIIGGDHDQRPNLIHGPQPRPRHDPIIGPLPDPDNGPLDLSRVQQRGGRAANMRRGSSDQLQR